MNLIFAIEELRQLLWQEAGVDRYSRGIKKALFSIYQDIQVTNNQPLLEFIRNQEKDRSTRFDEPDRKNLNLLLDLSHRQIASALLLEACSFRKESRGGHFRSDSPFPLPYWECHSVQKRGHNISTRPVTK